MDLGAAPPHRNMPTGVQTMTVLSQLGRIFDASVSVVFIALSLGLAGATAVVGA